METTVKNDLLYIIRETKKALKLKDPSYVLKQLSNHTVHNSSIFQDEYSISISILVYSLSKIIERTADFDREKLIRYLDEAESQLVANNIKGYDKQIKNIFSLIAKADHHFKNYVQVVMSQASIKKGSHIYAHGISASKAAELLGVSPWEFYEYLGATKIPDVDTDILSVRQRLQFTRKLFE